MNEELKKKLEAIREEIGQMPVQNAYTGNAMSAINACLDNLKWEAQRQEKAAKEEAEAREKKLAEARKLVSEDAAQRAAAAEVEETVKAAGASSPPPPIEEQKEAGNGVQE